MKNKKSRKTCEVCGKEADISAIQCHRCGTLFDNRSKFKKLVSKLRIFKRLKALELQNKKQAAVIMNVCEKR